MKAHDFFDLADRLPIVQLPDLLGDGGALVVAPHPDDESLGCGLLIASATADARPVRIVTISDGTASHPSSKAYPRERLLALREREARAAAAVLGVPDSHLAFLRLPDGHVPAQAAWAADIIIEEARKANARSLFVTWRHDPHCDHQAAYAIAREARRRSHGLHLFEYIIWGRDLPVDDVPDAPPRGMRFAAPSQQARKRDAIACHRSQVSPLITDDPNGFQLDPAMVARLIERDEIFLDMDP